MANRLLILGLTLVLAVAVVFGGAIRDGSLSGTSDGSNITIRWFSEDETGVLRYELERSAGTTGQFFLLSPIALKGNNASYEYVDDTAFRISESVYQYRIKVIFASGSVAYYGPITVQHAVSSVRRTWGSIKAMFR